jgi:hypothetical protein
MSWLPSPPLFRKSGGETVNAENTIESPELTRSQFFSSQKVASCHPMTGFCARRMTQTVLLPHSEPSNGGKAKRQFANFTICQILPEWTFFSSQGQSRSWLVASRQDKLVWGHPNHRQRRVRHCYSALDGSLGKV